VQSNKSVDLSGIIRRLTGMSTSGLSEGDSVCTSSEGGAVVCSIWTANLPEFRSHSDITAVTAVGRSIG